MESEKENMLSKDKLTFSTEDSNEFREIIRHCLERHQIETALFWYDKLVTLTGGEMRDVYWYADVLCRSGQYQRASTLLEVHSIDKICSAGRYLKAKCHFESKDYLTALSLLQDLDKPGLNGGGGGVIGVVSGGVIGVVGGTGGMGVGGIGGVGGLGGIIDGSVDDGGGVDGVGVGAAVGSGVDGGVGGDGGREDGSNGVPADGDSLLGGMYALKGQVYEAMENRDLAKECYKKALTLDCCCYEAFNNLIQHHMLNGYDEKQLIEGMKERTYGSEVSKEVSIRLYERMLKKYHKLQGPTEGGDLGVLEENTHVQVVNAENLFYNCNFSACHDVTSRILRIDPYNPVCLPVHIAVLVELKRTKDLFSLAHKLVDLCPHKEISWFAVGAYYFLISRQEQARRYLSKSTTLNRLFAPAWLMYGHSFALENEHDQAMAAYFSASKLMEGCHLPLMYIALEYMLTNNSRLAEKFFKEAGYIAPQDPFVLHEVAVIAFHNHQYTEAESKFMMVLRKIRKFHTHVQPDKWEPLYNNLGHVSRKLKKYSKSLSFHQKALTISPHNASTYTALGFTYALMGKLEQAINCFHKSLGLRKDDSFTTSMLSNVTDHHLLQYKPHPEAPQEVFDEAELRIEMRRRLRNDSQSSFVEADSVEEPQEEQLLQNLSGSIQDEEMEDAF